MSYALILIVHHTAYLSMVNESCKKSFTWHVFWFGSWSSLPWLWCWHSFDESLQRAYLETATFKFISRCHEAFVTCIGLKSNECTLHCIRNSMHVCTTNSVKQNEHVENRTVRHTSRSTIRSAWGTKHQDVHPLPSHLPLVLGAVCFLYCRAGSTQHPLLSLQHCKSYTNNDIT